MLIEMFLCASTLYKSWKAHHHNLFKVLQYLPNTFIIQFQFLTMTPEVLPDLASDLLSRLLCWQSNHQGSSHAALCPSVKHKFFATWRSPSPWSLLCLDSFFPRLSLAGSFLSCKRFQIQLSQRAPLTQWSEGTPLSIISHLLNSLHGTNPGQIVRYVLSYCISSLHLLPRHPPSRIYTTTAEAMLPSQHQEPCLVPGGCVNFFIAA